jgi:NADPH:quinone reductase-like Zn-dependent oxidoreductase
MPTKTLALHALAYALLASPSPAAIVQVKYEGVVNAVGSNTTGFSIGDAVWGEYFYDSQSLLIAGSIFQSEYAAVRYLSVHSTNGFTGSVNSGVINSQVQAVPPTSSLYPESLRPDHYRVTNFPAN